VAAEARTRRAMDFATFAAPFRIPDAARAETPSESRGRAKRGRRARVGTMAPMACFYRVCHAAACGSSALIGRMNLRAAGEVVERAGVLRGTAASRHNL
jgi:hypothetical protein